MTKGERRKELIARAKNLLKKVDESIDEGIRGITWIEDRHAPHMRRPPMIGFAPDACVKYGLPDNEFVKASRQLVIDLTYASERDQEDIKILTDLRAGPIAKDKVDGLNQPCVSCLAVEGTFNERGFNRCNACGYPGQ